MWGARRIAPEKRPFARTTEFLRCCPRFTLRCCYLPLADVAGEMRGSDGHVPPVIIFPDKVFSVYHRISSELGFELPAAMVRKALSSGYFDARTDSRYCTYRRFEARSTGNLARLCENDRAAHNPSHRQHHLAHTYQAATAIHFTGKPSRRPSEQGPCRQQGGWNRRRFHAAA